MFICTFSFDSYQAYMLKTYKVFFEIYSYIRYISETSQTPVTTLLFGDELQAHVTAIQALNQIIHTAVSHPTKAAPALPLSLLGGRNRTGLFSVKGQYQPKCKQKPWKKKEEPSKK